LSPVRTVAAVAGLVAGVENGAPDTVVAWPRNTFAVAVYSAEVTKVRRRPTTAAATVVARMSQRPLQSTRP
jgi:hypothetical protein